MGKKTERLTSKVELAQIRVGKYLRKGESGKIESVDAYVRKGLSVPEAHQLKIAKDTLKMPGPMAGVMGGPSPDEAKKTVARLEGKINEPKKGKPLLERKGKPLLERKGTPLVKRRGGIASGYTPQSPETYEKRAAASTPKKVASYEGVHPYKRKDNAELLRKQPSSQLKLGSTKAREDAAREYRKTHPSPKKKTTSSVEKVTGKDVEKKFLGHDANGNEIKEGSPVVVTAGPDKGTRGVVRGSAKGGGIRVEVAGNLGKTREVLVDPDELRVKSR